MTLIRCDEPGKLDSDRRSAPFALCFTLQAIDLLPFVTLVSGRAGHKVFNGCRRSDVDRSARKKDALRAPFYCHRTRSGRRIFRRLTRSPVMPESLMHSIPLFR